MSSLHPASNAETEPLLTWKKVQDTVPWNIILLLGGGFAMAKGCEVRAARGLQAWGGGCRGGARRQPRHLSHHQIPQLPDWDHQGSILRAWCCGEKEASGPIQTLKELTRNTLLPTTPAIMARGVP